MSEKLIIGLPSKGRLQENANAFFASAGLKVKQKDGRGYTGVLKGVCNVDIAFLSASEIAGNLESGAIHFGVTGEDLIREKIVNPEEKVELLLPLGFGHADVVVAVPQSWIDVRAMADLDDVARGFHIRHKRRLRVATKYLTLTRLFFAEHGISDYRIVESLGATEGAPAAGSAEAIVDITSTGATLAANNLKVLDDGVMLKSQANLVASLTATWCDTALQAATHVLDMITARTEAQRMKEIRFAAPALDQTLVDELLARFDVRVPQEARAALPASGELAAYCPSAKLYDVVSYLRENGITTVTARDVDYLFEPENALLARLKTRLGK
jgi:ATP phosphoribosyltransferase